MLQSSWERFQFFRTFLSSFALHFVPTNSKQQMPTWRKAIQCYLGPRAWKQSQKNIILQFKQYYMKNFISSLISSSKVKKKKKEKLQVTHLRHQVNFFWIGECYFVDFSSTLSKVIKFLIFKACYVYTWRIWTSIRYSQPG